MHFPAFLKNHVAILPPELWPRGIFVNWYVTGKLGKISKSKGGAEPIPDAAGRFGVDALRLYYAHIAAPFADVEWDESNIENYASRMERVIRTVDELKAFDGIEGTIIDRWLISRMNNRAGAIADAMNDYDLRRMANEAYFETLADVRWYVRRGGRSAATAARVLSMWIRMMAPITPHIAEEMWEGIGEKGFVSMAPYPEPMAEQIDRSAEVAETYLADVMSDINEILRVTGISPKKVMLYTAPEWKRRVFATGLELANEGKLTVPALTKAVMSRDELKRHGKEAADFARKTAEDLMKRAEGERKRLSVELDELDHLAGSLDFLTKEIGATVEVYSADDASAPDPQKKSRAAQPRRPAIYVE